jgi:hypothetical protein
MRCIVQEYIYIYKCTSIKDLIATRTHAIACKHAAIRFRVSRVRLVKTFTFTDDDV